MSKQTARKPAAFGSAESVDHTAVQPPAIAASRRFIGRKLALSQTTGLASATGLTSLWPDYVETIKPLVISLTRRLEFLGLNNLAVFCSEGPEFVVFFYEDCEPRGRSQSFR